MGWSTRAASEPPAAGAERFHVWRFPAFTVNRGTRLARSPRLLWVDSGLAAHLARRRPDPERPDTPRVSIAMGGHNGP